MCVCACECWWLQGPEASHSLKLEFQMFVSHLMWILGNELDSSGGATLTAEPSLHPHILYFIYCMVCGMHVLHVCAHVHRGQRSMSYFFPQRLRPRDPPG